MLALAAKIGGGLLAVLVAFVGALEMPQLRAGVLSAGREEELLVMAVSPLALLEIPHSADALNVGHVVNLEPKVIFRVEGIEPLVNLLGRLADDLRVFELARRTKRAGVVATFIHNEPVEVETALFFIMIEVLVQLLDFGLALLRWQTILHLVRAQPILHLRVPTRQVEVVRALVPSMSICSPWARAEVLTDPALVISRV
mmetsp:Transcript_36001/g.55303  ORF Transcript_36001/g.55303 Transcript_36001/m.55303 type:complete len:200 (-) Transcript_36001:1603-2202(-)|eukprot:CAMPEP_0170507496 /NCGR_PEP_ID=MMETSP0208-20121228/59016_1 /TAXON_ID=197538 /ORGANISM="Strombidium inclinatum, Strain S3" /LENGTH=199 /DNA_ID=CAMNT_0010789717 /DNA_START=2185 /DNA_END=2784 /DNA_ORIENTATION=-